MNAMHKHHKIAFQQFVAGDNFDGSSDPISFKLGEVGSSSKITIDHQASNVGNNNNLDHGRTRNDIRLINEESTKVTYSKKAAARESLMRQYQHQKERQT
jgi:hypothetical protein